MKRGLEKELEFIVEVPQRKKDVSTAIPTEFHLTPSTLDKVNSSVVGRVPGFDIQGVLHRKNCLINLPIMGEVVINSSENVIEVRTCEGERRPTFNTANTANNPPPPHTHTPNSA